MKMYKPKPPFNITGHLKRFTLPGAPTPGLYSGGEYRVLLCTRKCSRMRVRIGGEPWSPLVTVLEGPVDVVTEMLRARFDWARFQESLKPYPPLAGLASRYPGLRPGRCLSLYNALIDSIFMQRIPLRLALRLKARLVLRLGARAEYGGLEYYGYPPAHRLAEANIEELRSLRMPRLKARALVEVARAEAEGRIPGVGRVERDPWGVAGELEEIYGVGPWTAELAVAQVHPLFPIGPRSDLAVRRGLEALLGPGELSGVMEELGDYLGLVMYLAALYYEETRGKRG